MPLDFNELRQLLVTIAQTDIAELTLKSDDFELTVRKAVGISNASLPGATLPGGVVGLESTPATPPTSTVLVNGLDAPRGGETASSGFVAGQAATPVPKDQKLVEVISPMVGTFYRAPAPGEPSFVEVGDRVRSGQTVCIIEAMKLMNEIETEVSGQVVEILVQNGEPVEYGQPLLRLSPD
ncbi:acetyl-CoA carboxylase biotin carboxyl carrier protein [Gloeocapsopsis dulcis]|uniref:Biotin carboxyl carrier protein of acetyl-CoA carboxylase n=1 Tax=Gloeocapsopsis dulcis AAB1 = 1H9 TaxID=1433147 RepID=A0A6N8FPL1_9CHRO|nr:acetyl-CoA carboxylase biotin carboxyl carrier protein [Gloeocapsopsis dulcis]MUL35193.1 acetyl-CoA carboxylase, biotin carboxyl carrier protein [Gloeocapsopsis dulcis AAB1 = 1H9]WNN89079.1 acetyl-CoA carboxylase biotin carboxyl carrier protein [Gloeocapsopsis dulcis]